MCVVLEYEDLVSQGVISARLCVGYLWVIGISSIYRVKRLNGKFDILKGQSIGLK